MIKFISRVLKFTIVVLVTMGFVGLYNWYFLNKEPSLKNSETLVVGDSRMMTGLNPDVMGNCVNTAQNSESYFISYYKLKYLLKYSTGVKRILLGFSYPSLSAYLDGMFSGDVATGDILNRIYPIISLDDFHELKIDRTKYYQVWFKNMFVYPHQNHKKFIGGFEKLQPGMKSANLESVIQRHYYRDSNFVGVSKVSRNYLDSIVLLTKERNIELVLVNMPFQPEYPKKVPFQILNYFEAVKTEMLNNTIRILDYGNLEYDDENFKDHNHLSYLGAKKVTLKIKRDLGLGSLSNKK